MLPHRGNRLSLSAPVQESPGGCSGRRLASTGDSHRPARPCPGLLLERATSVLTHHAAGRRVAARRGGGGHVRPRQHDCAHHHERRVGEGAQRRPVAWRCPGGDLSNRWPALVHVGGRGARVTRSGRRRRVCAAVRGALSPAAGEPATGDHFGGRAPGTRPRVAVRPPTSRPRHNSRMTGVGSNGPAQLAENGRGEQRACTTRGWRGVGGQQVVPSAGTVPLSR